MTSWFGRGICVVAAGISLALLPFAPITYGRTLWDMAAVPSMDRNVTVTVTVVGPTRDELAAYFREHPAPPASGLPVTTGDNRTDLALFLVGETILVAGFFYLNHSKVKPVGKLTPATR